MPFPCCPLLVASFTTRQRRNYRYHHYNNNNNNDDDDERAPFLSLPFFAADLKVKMLWHDLAPHLVIMSFSQIGSQHALRLHLL